MMGEKRQKLPTATDLAKELIIHVSNLRALILILFMAFISIMFFVFFLSLLGHAAENVYILNE